MADRGEPHRHAESEEERAARLREEARKKARLDRAFGSMYPGQGYSGGGGFSRDHYEQQRPPHHGG